MTHDVLQAEDVLRGANSQRELRTGADHAGCCQIAGVANSITSGATSWVNRNLRIDHHAQASHVADLRVCDTDSVAGVVNGAAAVNEGEHPASFQICCHQGVNNQNFHISSFLSEEILGSGDGSSGAVVGIVSGSTSCSSNVQDVVGQSSAEQTSQLADDLAGDVLVDLAAQLSADTFARASSPVSYWLSMSAENAAPRVTMGAYWVDAVCFCVVRTPLPWVPHVRKSQYFLPCTIADQRRAAQPKHP